MSASYKTFLHQIIGENEEKHFWFDARSKLIRLVTQKFITNPQNCRFIEIGCGNGKIIRELESLGFKMTGLDINKQAIINSRAGTKATLIQKSILTYKPVRKFDAVGMFDLLEHLSHDLTIVKKCAGILVPGGYLFINVPAKKALWTEVDRISGHRKRYEMDEITSLVQKAGFNIVFINYWQCLAYPFYVVWQKLWQLKKTTDVSGFFRTPPDTINHLLLALLLFEQKLIFKIKFPFGTSIILVAKKN